jgi:hypothetical protein
MSRSNDESDTCFKLLRINIASPVQTVSLLPKRNLATQSTNYIQHSYIWIFGEIVQSIAHSKIYTPTAAADLRGLPFYYRKQFPFGAGRERDISAP